RGLAPLCALTSHVQSSLPGCPQPVVSRPSHRETPAPHPASLLSRRSRLLHNHATPCGAPLLWATERALRTLPSPRARSRCRRRAARGAGRKGLLFYLSVSWTRFAHLLLPLVSPPVHGGWDTACFGGTYPLFTSSPCTWRGRAIGATVAPRGA